MRALLVILAAALMASCAAPAAMHAADEIRSHNAAGGYADACGELPGLVGDDC